MSVWLNKPKGIFAIPSEVSASSYPMFIVSVLAHYTHTFSDSIIALYDRVLIDSGKNRAKQCRVSVS